MVITSPKLMTFSEFIEWIPENGYYELINGVVCEMQPKGKHEEIIAFIEGELFLETRRLNLATIFPKKALVKAIDKESGYFPDLLIVDKNALQNEPLWENHSTITKGSSINLVIEVVSSNWRDDYVYKLNDYERLGIFEYWIIDYLGLGGRRYIGDPKQPTLTICNLVDGEYQLQLLKKGDRIVSQVFPELNLTIEQIFAG
ncbi:MAG TPA: hypothetical protein DCF68_18435 [Cyanothece sp. UBA12306]|nr:hypothetical protein [Cyanothece sp. UBA12306]